MTPEHLANWLGAFRVIHPQGSLSTVEVFLRIAAGAETGVEILQAGAAAGCPMASGTMRRALALLRGRSQYRGGTWLDSPFEPLVASRRHPHNPGQQQFLTESGKELATLLEPSLTTTASTNATVPESTELHPACPDLPADRG